MWWPTPSSRRSTTSCPTGRTSRRTTPATVGCSSPRVQAGHVRHPLRLTQPAHLEPDHQGVADHVRPRHPGPGVQGRTLPGPRLRPLPGPPRRPDRLGPGRLHHTDNYPYAQNANSTVVPPGSGLSGTFNYVRNSVKVLINAYTGKMTFYVQDPNDPIIQTWEKAFPSMFTSASKMSPELRAHLRYPEDLFAVQATMYGRYHITSAPSFYNAADAWTLSPSPGSGPRPRPCRPRSPPTPRVRRSRPGSWCGWPRSTRSSRYRARASNPSPCSTPSCRVSGQSQIQTLSGFMIAGCDPGHYGQLTMYVTPREQPRLRSVHRGRPDRRHVRGVPSGLICSTRTGRPCCWATSSWCRWPTRCSTSSRCTWRPPATPSPRCRT